MNACVELVNGLGHRWAEGMWPIVWQSALLAGVVFLLTRLFRRAPATVRFWLWMLVPLRLLVMPLLTVSLPLLPAPSAVPLPAAQPLSEPGVFTPALEAVRAGLAAATAPEARPLVGEASKAVVWPTLWGWLMAVWLAGVVLFLLRLARGWLKMRRIVANADSARTPAVHEAAERVSRKVGLRRLLRILVTDENVSPFVSGVLRPVVVLPSSLVRQVPAEGLYAVVAHEFAHVRRREPVLGWLLAICEALYFFHPAFHLAKRRLIYERECACDDFAVALGEARRSVYARALIDAAGVCRTVRRQAAPAAVVAESFRDLKQRLTRLGSGPRPAGRVSTATVILLGLMAMVCLPGVALTAKAGDASEVKADEKDFTVTVSGRVIDTITGQPVPGARVRGHIFVRRYEGPEQFDRSPHAETTTDSKGTYGLTFATPLTTSGPMKGQDEVSVDASAPGYETRPQWLRPCVTPEKTEYTDVNFALEPGHRLRGKVVDEDGRPLVGALVTVNNGMSGAWHYFGSLGRTETDEKGEFELYCSTDPTTIGPRAWLIISKEGYGLDYVIDILKKEDLGTVVIPRGGTVVGRVVDTQGKGVPNCEVIARFGYQRPVSRSMTDAEGRYELKGIPGERVLRDFYTWKNRSYKEQLATFTVYARTDPKMELRDAPQYDIIAQAGKTATGPDLIVLTAKAGDASEVKAEEKDFTVTVSGRVIDTITGQPVPGARVRGHITVWRNERPELFDRSPYAETTTDSAGQYRLTFVTPLTTSGPMKGRDGICVDASAPGYETRPEYGRPEVTPENTEFADVNFALGPGHRLRGKVVDEDGRPLVGAFVTVNNGLNGDWEYFGSLGRTETDEKGEFELYCSTDSQTITSTAWLIISKEGYGLDYVTDILKKDDLGTVVIPRGGTVVGRVVDTQGKGVPNCEVIARRNTQRPVSRSMTDAEGRYELKGIPGERVFRDYYTWRERRYTEQSATFTVYARTNPNMELCDAPHYDILAQAGKTVTGPDLVVGMNPLDAWAHAAKGDWLELFPKYKEAFERPEMLPREAEKLIEAIRRADYDNPGDWRDFPRGGYMVERGRNAWTEWIRANFRRNPIQSVEFGGAFKCNGKVLYRITFSDGTVREQFSNIGRVLPAVPYKLTLEDGTVMEGVLPFERDAADGPWYAAVGLDWHLLEPPLELAELPRPK